MDFTKAKTFDPESIVQDAIFTVLMLTTQKCGKQNTSFIYLTISENANNSRYSNESGKQQRPRQQEKSTISSSSLDFRELLIEPKDYGMKQSDLV